MGNFSTVHGNCWWLVVNYIYKFLMFSFWNLNQPALTMWTVLIIAELRTCGAPWVRKYGDPSMQEILVLVITSVSVRPYIRTQHHRKTNVNGTLKYVKPVLPPAFVWLEVAWPTALKKEILKTTKYRQFM